MSEGPTKDLGEESTKDLTAVEMLRLVLADIREMKAQLGTVETRLGAVETELSTLQSTVDDRLKDTRPIWQAINQRTERMEARLDELTERMGTVSLWGSGRAPDLPRALCGRRESASTTAESRPRACPAAPALAMAYLFETLLVGASLLKCGAD